MTRPQLGLLQAGAGHIGRPALSLSLGGLQ